jgi:hypothetical protein
VNHAAIREMFELLYGMPPATCAHCHRPKHPEPCPEQIKYDRAMNGDDIDEQRRIEDCETARAEDREFNACSNATDWEA